MFPRVNQSLGSVFGGGSTEQVLGSEMGQILDMVKPRLDVKVTINVQTSRLHVLLMGVQVIYCFGVSSDLLFCFAVENWKMMGERNEAYPAKICMRYAEEMTTAQSPMLQTAST